jgi:hypothetical protein
MTGFNEYGRLRLVAVREPRAALVSQEKLNSQWQALTITPRRISSRRRRA